MRNNTKILIFDPTYAKSVNRVPILLRIKFWQKKGLLVSILCSTEARKYYESNLSGITFYTFKFSWKAKEYYGAIIEYLRANFLAINISLMVRNKVDIIYSLSSTLDTIFLPWLIKLITRRIKWYVKVDNTVPKPWERPGSIFLKTIPYLAFLISNLLLQKADGTFVIADFLKKYYEKRNVKVIKTGDAYGLELEIFRGKINPASQKFNALFGGRLHPAKGIYDLVDIVNEIVRVKKDFTLGIMGDGAHYHKKKLQEKIKVNNLNKNITLVGYKEGKERGDLYRNCDLFLFPSYAEGLTIVVLEALAANKPVVSYDLPEYHDVFQKYLKSGQLTMFAKGNTSDIAKYIIKGEYLNNNFHNKLEDYSWDKNFEAEYLTFIGKKYNN